jgi:outer membrane protein TolC
MNPLKIYKILLLSVCFQSSALWAENTLSLKNAEQLALQSDPLTKSFSQYAQSFEEESIASDQWPDPKLKLGFLSLPTDSFDLGQEPMTQVIVGYSQMIPRGDSQLYKAELMQAKANMKIEDMSLRQRKVILNVRKAWLKVYLKEASEKIIQKNRHLFKQQLEVSQSLYAAGRKQQQDVLQAELELSLLDDKLQQIASQKNEARALLGQWVGNEVANYQLDAGNKSFGKNIEQKLIKLMELLEQHPFMKKEIEKISVSQQQVKLAEQKYRPQWGFDLTYGKRDGNNNDGSDRADFISAMVNVDVPVFSEDKQDRVLASKKRQVQAAHYEKQDMLLKLQSQLKQAYARWEKLKTRLNLYDKKVLIQAEQNSKAALNGYQSGVVTFFTLTRARSAELKAQLQRIKLNIEQAIAYTEIRFLVGEDAK